MNKRSLVYAGLTLLVVVVVIGAVLLVYGVDRLGFRESTTVSTQETQQGATITTEVYQRTLWDLLGLLIVPIVLVVGAFLLNLGEQRRQEKAAEERVRRETIAAEERLEREAREAAERARSERLQALDRLREDRLQDYLDRVQDLLEKGLTTSPQEAAILRDIARTRTLTVLRGLDVTRKAIVIQFLHESGLIGKTKALKAMTSPTWVQDIKPVVSLVGADLSKAKLVKARLPGITLAYTNLREANFADCIMPSANLMGANLRGANLARAMLYNSRFIGADVSGADLREAKLGNAEFNLTKYDDATKWPAGFDPVAAGAKKIDSKPSDEMNTDDSE